MTVKRVETNELRKIGRPGVPSEPIPAGISPILRASWQFARGMAQRFSRELLSDRTKEFLDKLSKRFA
ncbi:hypothetical protein HZB08_01840 [Candidatus Saganbacteria bacterium]|uniref:Uncharacterized protein n=1 Tax=Candidatus Saganbacteria bacterium TaxID=2575572 RepID=A0A9D6UJX9_UNCSA|nr:hypothetical protein [Candidatus Saganbacteria bacterium]